MQAGATALRREEGLGSPPLRARVSHINAVPDALAPQWQELAAAASEPNAFAEPWFVAPSLHHLAPEPARLIEVREGDTLAGLILVGIEPHYGRIPVPHVENWRHHHLFLGTPLVRAGREAAFWQVLLDVLDDADWAHGFLHVRDLAEGGAVHRGLEQAAAEAGRPCAIVYREQRAFLQSRLSATAYYEETIRKKKRKELARLRNRLAGHGSLETRELRRAEDVQPWCDAFLALERSGWKGRKGSALACRPATEAFFREAVAGAQAAGRLQFLRLDVAGRPVAMLVNFLTPPGSFSFKTAFDEAFARFSPGVLLQLDNLNILDNPGIAWMDSCAAEQHPMIDSLWAQRRTIVRVTVPLSGVRRRLVFAAARGLEEASAARRRLQSRSPVQEPQA